MRTKLLAAALMAGVSAAACSSPGERAARDVGRRPNGAAEAGAGQAKTGATQGQAAAAHAAGGAHAAAHPHGIGAPAGRVPAFVTDAASLKDLAPTLPPENFTGMRRAGYEAARAIPQTLAQLPCYCHCDRGFGHKSLHSCFVDGHAADCSICLEEALLAYKLEKEQKLKPEQIRERIVAQYGGR